ncbi:SH2 domain-containing protein 5 [Oreochromis niloticus]|uniref:SH2 domain-containing protein 5 n=1 Tax=Oreochromis niloticus TaxID=8128 RepID=UPI000905904B|nr:SH2 domain-containing protein 5 [Oreochromis niloticus]XP_019214636.1 SH2 domain-containing protein 5 [Oreochromis niloticus]XP_019214637.1 SH2 domain-containing protein 5 [Oreochromis niloticus]
MGEAPVREDSTVTRSAEYVGSFPVDDNCLDDQIKQLHTQLKSLKACKRRRPVSLKFSIKGVKMYNEDETILLMAHALRRISLSTARPVDSQFAFVAHNPGCPDTQLYCHVFKARHARAKTPKSSDDQQSSQDEVFPISSPSLMRKKVIRTKVLRSGAYRSFTFTPRKQRTVQDQLSVTQEKDLDKSPAKRSRAPSLAETEEALAQAVWCWAGIATESSYSLLADDVLGSYLLCQHPKKPKCGSLIIRFPSGPITHLIENTRKGKFVLEKCKTEFNSMAELIEHYTETEDELPCLLSYARVNHCYEWEENVSKQQPVKLQRKRSRN